MSKKKQGHLEPKSRPVHKIYSSLKTMGKQDPTRMCVQGQPSEWRSSWLTVEFKQHRTQWARLPLEAFTAPLLTTPKPHFENPGFEATFLDQTMLQSWKRRPCCPIFPSGMTVFSLKGAGKGLDITVLFH